jgi:hypothetical protein
MRIQLQSRVDLGSSLSPSAETTTERERGDWMGKSKVWATSTFDCYDSS